jgi:hypothetical protein
MRAHPFLKTPEEDLLEREGTVIFNVKLTVIDDITKSFQQNPFPTIFSKENC